MIQVIERLIYEVRPFFYLGGAYTAHSLYSSIATNIFAIMLCACMGLVLYWRFQYRVVQARTRR